MLENVSEGDRLHIFSEMWDVLPEKDKKKYGTNQKFIEKLLERDITLTPEVDDSRTMKLADSINKMADALEVALQSGFNRRLLVLFIQDSLGRELGKGKIEMVLDAVLEFIDETREA